jgi:protein involved in polysaccharide export with SLBB domain
MDAQGNSEPVAPSLPDAASRRGKKPLLLVLGFSAIAVLGAGAVKTWEHVEIASGAVVQKVPAEVGARQDQPAQATPETSRAVVPGPDASAATLIERSAVPATPTIAERPKTVGTAPDALPAGLFGVGDRLKLAFYERVDVEEDKWGRTSSASALRSILQRPELSGEYTVQEDGTITVPLLGSVPVAHRSAQQVQADLMETFEQLLGRKGMANILSLERSPIYVLGPVKNPGSFKYVPGMTILHAIALAGGLDRAASDPWQKIEAVREIQKRSGAVDAMLKLLARRAVLKAERDGTEPKIPPRLTELVGATEAANFVNEQNDRRKAVAVARKNRERATLTGLESAKQDVAVYGRMEALDELVKLRQNRVNSMRTLVDRNVLGMPVLNQAQSELTDAEQRRREALNQYAMAKQRLASMESEAQRVQADLKNDLETEIETIERQIVDNEREFSISESVLDTLPVTRAQFAKENRVSYQVVRQTAAGPIGIESARMSVLQPGDLVNIIVGESEPKEQKGAPAPALPAGQILPASEATRAKEAAERTADELRQALQQEHEKAETLASDLAKARSELETQAATKAADDAKRQPAELRQALHKAEALRHETSRLASSPVAGSSDMSGQMPAPATDKPTTAALPTPDGRVGPPGPASDMQAMGSTAASKQPSTMAPWPATAQTTADLEAARLVVGASLLLEQGHIGAARSMLDRAVELGSAQALFVLAETYDPRILSVRKKFGTQSDSAKARELYAKALASGIREAQERLDALRP